MKLLIITQKVDIDDDVLGFVHRWIEKLSPQFDLLNVICLKRGQYSLPPNVKVWSLGKEVKKSRIQYIFRFYKYIWKLRKNYDAIFVHMNPIYVVLGGVFWKIWKKKIYLWYNHQYGTLITKLAIRIANTVFYTSPFSFASKFKKSKIMPAGIDTEIFKNLENIQKQSNTILYLGRISPIKDVDVLVKTVNLLEKEGIKFVLNIVGEPGEKDEEYFKKIKVLSKNLEIKGKIKFLGKAPNYKTPEIYNQNEVFINLSPSGSFDKTTLEAMACQTLVLVSSRAFQNILPSNLIFKEKNPEDLKNKIIEIFNMESEKKEDLGRKLRKQVLQNHSLNILIEKFIDEFKKQL